MSSGVNLIFGYPLGSPGGQLGDSADATPSLIVGAADPLYPLINIYNGNSAKPFKCTGTTVQILFNFGSARTVHHFALLHHNLDNALAGVSVKQGTTSSVADATTALTIPSADVDGYTVSPWIRLTSIGSKQYLRLNIDTANSVPIIIGEICIQLDDRQLPINYNFGAQLIEIHHFIRHQTNMGVSLTYDLGTRRKVLKGEITADTTNIETYLSWKRAVRGQPHLVIPNGLVNEALYMQFENMDMNINLHSPNLRPFTFSLVEISRGLPWNQVA